MRAYADSSFLVKLVAMESDSQEAVSQYRRAGRPDLFYLALLELEVTNAILHQSFHSRRSSNPEVRRSIARVRDEALGRLKKLVMRGSLRTTEVEADEAHRRSMELILKHTEKLGVRAIDALHVAYALILECEIFFTTDERQAELAVAEGLVVRGAE